MHSLHIPNILTVRTRTYILNFLSVYNIMESMPMCLVITQLKVMRPENSAKRNQDKSRLLFLSLQIFSTRFMFMYYLPPFQRQSQLHLLLLILPRCSVPPRCNSHFLCLCVLFFNLLPLGCFLWSAIHIFVPLMITLIAYTMQNTQTLPLCHHSVTKCF